MFHASQSQEVNTRSCTNGPASFQQAVARIMQACAAAAWPKLTQHLVVVVPGAALVAARREHRPARPAQNKPSFDEGATCRGQALYSLSHSTTSQSRLSLCSTPLTPTIKYAGESSPHPVQRCQWAPSPNNNCLPKGSQPLAHNQGPGCKEDSKQAEQVCSHLREPD